MTAAALLEKLDAVRSTGPDRWIARCPAHADRSPSLSVRELADGRVLVHDHAGCDVRSVLTAVNLDFDDLFPAKAVDHHRPMERRAFHAEDVLRALKDETEVAAIICARITCGFEVDRSEYDRLMVAVVRIANAAVAAGVDEHDHRLRHRIDKRRRELAKAA
jgi:hypothetical protein